MALDGSILNFALPFGAAGAGLLGAPIAQKFARSRKRVMNFMESIPWGYPLPDNVTVLCPATNFAFRVLRVKGSVFSAMEDTTKSDLIQRRKQWNMHIAGKGITVRVLTSHTSVDIQHYAHGSDIMGQLNQKWDDHVSDAKKTDHYVIIGTRDINDLSVMDEAVTQFKALLSDTAPTLLSNAPDNHGHSRLMEFLDYVLNFRVKPIPALYDDLAHELVNSHYWATNDGYIITETDGVKSYHAAICVRTYGRYTSQDVVNNILGENTTFDLMVRYKPLGQKRALAYAMWRKGQDKTFFSGSQVMKEWDQIIDDINAGKDTIVETEFVVFPRASSIEKLNKIVGSICDLLGNKSYHVQREVRFAWDLWCSRIPGIEEWTRPRELYTENVSELMPFSSAPVGNDTCLWGPRPVRHIPTAGENAPFAFTVQPNAGNNDADSPHGALFMDTGKGKTVWLNFLSSGALDAYPDLRVVNLDYRHGLRVFSEFMGGTYLMPGDERLQINMFDCEDNADNRQMVLNMLRLMGGFTDIDTINELDRCVRNAFLIPREQKMDDGRRMRAFHKDFFETIFTTGDLKKHLQQWLPNNQKGGYLTGNTDTFDPTASRYMAIGMDSVFSDHHVSSVYTYYLMKRIENEFVSRGFPYWMLIDEASTLLANPHLNDMVRDYHKTARKNRGSVYTVWQSVKDCMNTPIGDTILKNVGTYWFYQGSASDPEELKPFKLTETEERFVLGKFTPPNSVRPVLMKRKDGDSVFLDVDLSCLGPYLKVLEGSLGKWMNLKKCQEDYPGAWREKFLGL